MMKWQASFWGPKARVQHIHPLFKIARFLRDPTPKSLKFLMPKRKAEPGGFNNYMVVRLMQPLLTLTLIYIYIYIYISTTPGINNNLPYLPQATGWYPFCQFCQDPWLDPSTVELTLQMHSTAEEQLRLEELTVVSSFFPGDSWGVKIGIPVEQWHKKR